MPAGDRTGSLGFGPRTGRAAGYCAGSAVPGYLNRFPERGFWGRDAYQRRPWPGYLPRSYAGVSAPRGYGSPIGRGLGRGWGRGLGGGRGFGRGRW